MPDVDIDNVDIPGPSSDIIGTSDTSFRDVSLKLDYDLENFTLTSITGYAEVRQSFLVMLILRLYRLSNRTCVQYRCFQSGSTAGIR